MKIHPCARPSLDMLRLQFQKRRLVPEDDPDGWTWYFPLEDVSLAGWKNETGDAVELRATNSHDSRALEFEWWAIPCGGAVQQRIAHHQHLREALPFLPQALAVVGQSEIVTA